jgi:hypothetical protein
MLATELLFIYIYSMADDAIKAGVLSIRVGLAQLRPAPTPSC